jgi:predicted transcriptional regulator
VSDRLYQKGWIENPRNKNQSFKLTDSGREACERLFRQYFASNAP